jgi:phosphoribosyl-dephospho-CoA transferase
VHALLRIPGPDALVWDAHQPAWTAAALQRAPWTVVRRAAPRAGLWPVGVRGSVRAQRSAAWLPAVAMQACVTPQQLAAQRAWRQRTRVAATPPVAVLDEVEEILAAHGCAGRWGPAGSVGFELASGILSTSAASDLDLVLDAKEPIARSDALRLHGDLTALAVRIDLLLETPHGAVALEDYARGDGAMLLRSMQGPRLVRDPWRPNDPEFHAGEQGIPAGQPGVGVGNSESGAGNPEISGGYPRMGGVSAGMVGGNAVMDIGNTVMDTGNPVMDHGNAGIGGG